MGSTERIQARVDLANLSDAMEGKLSLNRAPPRPSSVSREPRGGSDADLSSPLYQQHPTTPEHEGYERFANACGRAFEEDGTMGRLLREASEGATVIPRIRSGDASQADVTSRHLAASQPVIVTGALDAWPALHAWDLPRLAARFGTPRVVANDRAPARQRDRLDGRPQRSVTVTLAEYAEYATRCGEGRVPGAPFYLNGWHAFKRHPELLDEINYPDSLGFLEDHTRTVLVEIDKALQARTRGGMAGANGDAWVHGE